MTDYNNDLTVREKSRTGTTIAIAIAVIVVIVGLLFATGFWSADVKKGGSLPEVSVKGGELPDVDLDSKKVVVGTKDADIEVPKVEAKTETVSVPVVGVKD